MPKKLSRSALASFIFSVFLSVSAFAESTAFTYQGRLSEGGGPAAGIYDLRFALYDSPSGGSVIGGPQTNSAVVVSNGMFIAQVDFGAAAFNGSPRWLEIAVRTNGATSFAALTPLQAVAPAPYAIMANNASNVLGQIP